MAWISYSVEEASFVKPLVSKLNRNKYIFRYPCANSSTCTNYNITILPGKYKMECYGAGFKSGGAYTSGIIDFITKQDIFVFLGGKGSYGSSSRFVFGFNGGGGGIVISSALGSGATDVRLKGGEWNSFSSLKSRIMVAGGSGGTECGKGGPGGGLNGINGMHGFCSGDTYCYTGFGSGANQVSGGNSDGMFGYAFSSLTPINKNRGGGGYYGGGMSIDAGAGGGGGSSFISGHQGCDAISFDSTINNIKHTNQPIHFSNLSFYHTMMKDGNTFFMDAFGKKELGHHGDGVFVITNLNSFFSCKACSTLFMKTYVLLIISLVSI